MDMKWDVAARWIGFIAFIALLLVFSSIHATPLEQSKNLAKFDMIITPSFAQTAGNVQVRLTHSTFTKIDTEEDLNRVIEGKIDVATLARTEAFVPLLGVNVSIYYLDISGGEIKRTLICKALTDADGSVRCPLNVAISSCGKIEAEFEGTDTDAPTVSAPQDYCVQSAVPFVFLIDSNMIMIFIFFGLLAAGLYAAGRNPLAAIDITTPRVRGPSSYPSYLHEKVKLFKAYGPGKITGMTVAGGRNLVMYASIMSRLSSLEKAGVLSGSEIRNARDAASGGSAGAKYTAMSALAFKKYNELVKKIEFTQKQIDQLSTQGGKSKQARQHLLELQDSEKRLERIKEQLTSVISSSVRELSAPHFVVSRANAKAAEALALMNKEKWKCETWVEESQRLLRLRTDDPHSAVLIPIIDARLHIDETRMRILSQAVAEIEEKGTEKQKDKADEISSRLRDPRKDEKDAIGELLEMLRDVNSKLSEDLNRLYSKTMEDSDVLNHIELAILDRSLDKEKARRNDNEEAVDEASKAIQSLLLEGYDYAIAIIGMEANEARKSKLATLESRWKGNEPPAEGTALVTRFTAIAPNSEGYEKMFSSTLSDSLAQLEHLIETSDKRGVTVVQSWIEPIEKELIEKIDAKIEDYKEIKQLGNIEDVTGAKEKADKKTRKLEFGTEE